MFKFTLAVIALVDPSVKLRYFEVLLSESVHYLFVVEADVSQVLISLDHLFHLWVVVMKCKVSDTAFDQ